MTYDNDNYGTKESGDLRYRIVIDEDGSSSNPLTEMDHPGTIFDMSNDHSRITFGDEALSRDTFDAVTCAECGEELDEKGFHNDDYNPPADGSVFSSWTLKPEDERDHEPVPQTWAQAQGAALLIPIYVEDGHGPYTSVHVTTEDHANAVWVFTAAELSEDWTDSAEGARTYVDAMLSEYQNWANGEVYGVIIEKRVTWASEDGETMDTWEDTGESVWGFIGLDHAEAEADEMLKYAAKGVAA